MPDFSLWPFQTDIVRASRDALRNWRAIGIIMPTGSGKTRVAADMLLQIHRQIGERQGSLLFLVHRKELLRQTAKRLDEAGLSDAYGFIAPGMPMKPWAPFHIVSIPALMRRIESGILDWINPVAIVIDEGHHATAYTWAKILNTFPDAYKMFLTATPMRNDDSGLGDMIDHLVLGPQIKELVAPPGYLAGTECFAVPPSFEMTRATLKAQAEQQTSAVVAATVDNFLRIKPTGNAIFFAVDIEHSKSIVEKLNARGISAAHVDYKTPDDERTRTFENMAAGRIQCVSNVTLFTEGIDWPECDTVVLARNTTSFTLFRQMCGRYMRRKIDGRPGTAIDLAGNIYLHGLPDDDVEWELEYGVDLKKQKSTLATTQMCEMCSYIFPKEEPVCPLCGVAPLKPVVMETDVEVGKVDDSNRPEPRPKPTKRKLNDEIVATGGNIDELRKLRAKYGYNARWPARMQEIFKYAWGR